MHPQHQQRSWISSTYHFKCRLSKENDVLTMFRLRRHTCKVVLITSLVWCLIIFFLLLTVFDCSSGGCGGGGGKANVASRSGKHDAIQFAADSAGQTGRLRRWTAVNAVIMDQGMPGAGGKPVTIPKSREEERKEKFRINQFNLLASEMISLNRSLADVRLSA